MTVTPIPICGRPRANGVPCRRPRYAAPACPQHQTEAERDEIAQAWSAFDWAIPDRPAEPACWGWLLPASEFKADPDDLLIFLARWQAGRCATCGDKPDRLVLDHDHATALVRGYLCHSCNISEAFRGGIYADYRKKNPATMLGLEIVYWSPVSGYAVPIPPEHPDDKWKDNPLANVGL